MTDNDRPAPPAVTLTRRFALLAGGGVLGIFSIGVIAGIAKAAMERGTMSWKVPLLMGIAALLVIVAIRLVIKGLGSATLAKSPKMREYQLVTVASLVVGGVIGALMQVGASSGPAGADGFFAGMSGPLSPWVTAVLLAMMPLFAWLCYRWHMSADEHEQAAYNFGGMLSLYFYFFASFGWWIAWRGGLVGEPSGFAIFWLVLIVWSIGWAWRRYR